VTPAIVSTLETPKMNMLTYGFKPAIAKQNATIANKANIAFDFLLKYINSFILIIVICSVQRYKISVKPPRKTQKKSVKKY